MTYPIKVSWQYTQENYINQITTWNHICSIIVERFGLPGDQYTTEVTNEYMTFHFNNAGDALLAKLIIGDCVN